MNPFEDQKFFMNACGQTTETFNLDQLNLYLDLIQEEMISELTEAKYDFFDDPTPQNLGELFDALGDSLVVIIGALLSTGVNPEWVWNAIYATNLAKVDVTTGKVKKREDGKILKPEGWEGPHRRLLEIAKEVM